MPDTMTSDFESVISEFEDWLGCTGDEGEYGVGLHAHDVIRRYLIRLRKAHDGESLVRDRPATSNQFTSDFRAWLERHEAGDGVLWVIGNHTVPEMTDLLDKIERSVSRELSERDGEIERLRRERDELRSALAAESA